MTDKLVSTQPRQVIEDRVDKLAVALEMVTKASLATTFMISFVPQSICVQMTQMILLRRCLIRTRTDAQTACVLLG